MKDDRNKITGLVRELKAKNRKKVTALCLSGTAVVAEAKEAAEILGQLLATKKPVVLDLNEISEVDISFIQLLLALGKSIGQNNQNITLAPLPAQHALHRASRLAGIVPIISVQEKSWFGIPLANEEKN